MRWYLAALFIMAVALSFGLGLVAYSMYVLLGLLLVSRWMASQGVEQITAAREMDRDTAEVGDDVTVTVMFNNKSRFPIPWILAEDLLPRKALAQRPPRLSISGQRLAVFMLKRVAAKRIRYHIRCDMRGYYQIGPVVLESGDVFGLYRKYRVLTVPTFLRVYPKIVPIPNYDIASRRPLGEVKLMHRLFEDPTRISGVRAYQQGDPLSRVHWRATARTGMLHSKTYDTTCIAGMTVVLDFHQSSYSQRYEPLSSELAVTTAASLANAVYETGEQIGLVTNARDAADRVSSGTIQVDIRNRNNAHESAGMLDKNERLRPLMVPTRRGYEQFRQILESLVRVELTDGLTLSQLLAETASQLPKNATVMAVLSGVTYETAISLGALRRQGFAVSAAVIAFDPDEWITAAGMLMSQRIDARRVENEESLSAICSQLVMR